MKIDIVGPSYPFRGGISHYTTLLSKSLKKKHDVKFYCFKRQYPALFFPGKTDRDLSRQALRDNDAIPVLDSLNPFTWFKLALKIIKDRPDCVIFPWWVTFWAPQFFFITSLLKLFSRSKILFLCHNVAEHESNSLKALLSKIVLRLGDSFIVHSDLEKKCLHMMTGKKMIKVTFHPSYAVFNSGSISKKRARKKLGIKESRVLLFFGFVRKYKGLQYLLEAMPHVLQEQDLRLLIAGEFWADKERYTSLIRLLNIEDKVSVVDAYIPNEEIPFYFHASDIVVLPYTSVTGSGLIQLAFGFHKPVIVSGIGSFNEVVTEGKTGFLVEPRSPSGIAKAVRDFYGRYDEEEMAAHIAIGNNRFSWDRLVETIEGIFMDAD